MLSCFIRLLSIDDSLTSSKESQSRKEIISMGDQSFTCSVSKVLSNFRNTKIQRLSNGTDRHPRIEDRHSTF
eukprot:g62715.t1